MSRIDAQKALEQELENSRIQLLSGEGPAALLTAIKSELPDLSDNLYIISSVPEQCEDIYDVLVDATTIVHVEVPRRGVSDALVIEQMPLERYQQMHSTLTKFERRRLDAALRLARQRQVASSKEQ